MEVIGIGVAIAVISAALIGGFRWLAANREHVVTEAKQRTCRHEWELINKPGESVVLVTGDAEWCVKCGARR